MTTTLHPNMEKLFRIGVETELKEKVINAIVREHVEMFRAGLETELRHRLAEVTFESIKQIEHLASTAHKVMVTIDMGGGDVRKKTMGGRS